MSVLQSLSSNSMFSLFKFRRKAQSRTTVAFSLNDCSKDFSSVPDPNHEFDTKEKSKRSKATIPHSDLSRPLRLHSSRRYTLNRPCRPSDGLNRGTQGTNVAQPPSDYRFSRGFSSSSTLSEGISIDLQQDLFIHRHVFLLQRGRGRRFRPSTILPVNFLFSITTIPQHSRSPEQDQQLPHQKPESSHHIPHSCSPPLLAEHHQRRLLTLHTTGACCAC